MTEWQPIYTAPRDGTKVLLYGRPGLSPRRWPDRHAIGYWHQPANAAREGSWMGIAYPTHWMPLPAPPSTRDENGQRVDLGTHTQGTDASPQRTEPERN